MVHITIAKLKFLPAYNMAIRYQTAKFKSANILAIAILGPTTKFNSANISSYMYKNIMVFNIMILVPTIKKNRYNRLC